MAHFGARWLDSYLGRFTQADSIIPGARFSIAWDRYAGLLNNPLKYVDQSGHRPCDGEQVDDCDSAGFWIFNLEASLYEPLPNVASQVTLESYNIIRQELFVVYGGTYLNYNGKIKDSAFLTLIAQEFKNLSDPVYGESIEALSMQYNYENYPNGCKGNGCTLSEQLTWMQDIQALRDISVSTTHNKKWLFDNWLAQWSAAQDAMNPEFIYGSERASWTWGNYDIGSQMEEWVLEVNISHYVEAEASIDYRFVVLTLKQNLECNTTNCKANGGWWK